MVMKQLSYSGLIIALLSIISLSIVPHCVMATNQTDNVSNRIVTGTARIITSSSQLSTVCAGDIVVARMTDVSWESALSLAAGIITDKGDSSSHAVLFGKRMGIPVIVGAGNATETISDGQTVTIDCSKNSFYTAPAAISDVTVSHYRMTHTSVPHSAPSGYSTTSSHSSGSASQPSAQKTVTIHQQVNTQGQKNIKELYNRYYNDFEKYILGLKRQLDWTPRSVVEGGAAFLYNKFTVACIPISYPFFNRSKEYIVRKAKLIDCDSLVPAIERCKQKPGNIKWLDWVAQVSHEEHIKNVTLSACIDKERLMAHPEEYQKIINQNRVSVEERDTEIIKGLFVRFLVEENLLFRT